MPQGPLAIQTEHLDHEAAAWLADRCELVVCPPEELPRFEQLLPRAEALVIRTYTRVDDALLARARKLKVVGRAGVGLDNVDIQACQARGVRVVSTPGANTRAVVELVTAFMFDALRPRLFIEGPLAKAEWGRVRSELIAPRQLGDLTLGVVGFGRVGSAIARVGAAMDMRVVYSDLLEIPADRRSGATPAALQEVLEQADVLTIHVDGRAENRNLIGARELSRMKREVVLINTSRGFVVAPMALAEFLIANKGAQAILDVHEPEPIEAAYPLFDLPNAHLSPHIGAATATAHRNMSWVVRDVWRVLNGEKPENPAW